MKYRTFFCSLVLVLLCGGLASPQGNADEGPSFKYSVKSQLVEVYLTVTKGKQLVPNLTASDFTLLEDGEPVTIDRVDNPDVPLQIVLLFDLSESVRDSLKSIQDAAIAFVESLKPHDRVTLVFFNSDIQVHHQESDDRRPLIKEIKNAQAQGMTKLYDAMLLAMKHLKGRPGRKAIVCFTDGQDTSGTSSRIAVLNAAARFGFPIYTIGAGAGLELTTLKMILREFAEINSGKALFIQNVGKLKEAFKEIEEELHSAYVLAYYTQVPPDGSFHTVSVRVSDSDHKAHCRKGFYAQREFESGSVSVHHR
ncbi:MAG: VWA domain-containing protein [Acidobacteria bacterium]|nr:VWA domain-containing protein [Acidobacteriota bacterium]